MEKHLRPEAEAAKAIGKPSVLLIYGDQDKYTPPAHGERLARAFGSAASADLWVLPGIDHTFAYRDASDAYAARVVPFLAAALKAAATTA